MWTVVVPKTAYSLRGYHQGLTRSRIHEQSVLYSLAQAVGRLWDCLVRYDTEDIILNTGLNTEQAETIVTKFVFSGDFVIKTGPRIFFSVFPQIFTAHLHTLWQHTCM